MHERPSPTSADAILSAKPPEEFGPPGVTSLATLTDGREPGDFKSAYPLSVWVQIATELVYLLFVLIGSVAALIWLARSVLIDPSPQFLPWLFGSGSPNATLVLWFVVGLSGACGGSASVLKWLYHTVAKRTWHRDRAVWRFVVPILSSVLSVFTGMMITSGIVPFFSSTSITNPVVGAGFGFFVGLFSDNLLASLQRLAHRIFGTVDLRRHDDNSKN